MTEKFNQNEKPSSDHRPLYNEIYKFRINIFMVLILIGFSVLIYRLFYLQVIRSDYLSGQAVNNKRQIIRLPSYRGEIFLGDGQVVAKNLSTYSIYVIPKNFPLRRTDEVVFNKLVKRISESFEISEKKIISTLNRSLANPYQAYLLKDQVTPEKIYFLAENLESFPGLIYQDTLARTYPLGETYAHVSGYVQPISSRDFRRKQNLGYGPNSIIGKTGVEAYYDLDLRGKDGYKVNIVDVKNRIKEELFPEDGKAEAGKNLFLTIDPKIQTILHRTLQGMPGGAIITRVSTGEILGLYSYPFFDPNIFSMKNNRAAFNKYLQDERNPFLNRVIQAQYPPSSIFKLPVALAALDDPKITTENTSFYCEGSLTIGDTIFKCTGYHGEQNFLSAIANSCNVFFYRLGIQISPQVIEEYTKTYFNFGELTGIDLAYEKRGRIPSPKWKIENLGTFWWDGDTANLSIGQGFALTTVIQINTMTAAIANDGKVFKPHLVNRMQSLEDGKFFDIKPSLLSQLPFSIDNIRYVQKSMRQVVRWGTARRINNDRILLAGKTGTAQSVKGEENHAWFTGYTPYGKDKDKIAITVFVENGGFGSVYPATFTDAILQAIYLNRDPLVVVKEKLQPWSTQKDKYEHWLNLRNQEPLPESYFN